MTNTSPTLNQVRASPAMLSKLCTRLVSIRELIGLSNKMICCPFHKDDTPSAKFFEDSDGDRLWCYGCNKMYNSYHYLKRIREVDPFVFLLERFDRRKLEQECKLMDFVEERKNVNIDPALKVFKETGNVILFLDKLYALRSEDS